MNRDKLKEALALVVGNSAKIPCPFCVTYKEEQLLIPGGDDSTYLFCPYCGFTINLDYNIDNWTFRNRTKEEWIHILNKSLEIKTMRRGDHKEV